MTSKNVSEARLRRALDEGLENVFTSREIKELRVRGLVVPMKRRDAQVKDAGADLRIKPSLRRRLLGLPPLSFSERSFRNLVEFYADELRKIQAGTDPLELFTYVRIVSLKKWGILQLAYNPHRSLVLTERARGILNESKGR